MRRREFITLLGSAAAAWPLAARAQQSSGRPSVGLLSPLSETTATRNIEGFRAGLRELGYVEGRNITLALRFADGMSERMPALAAELVALKPDVMIAAPGSAGRCRPAHGLPSLEERGRKGSTYGVMEQRGRPE
jgi:putative ABC transport system substrate-binding protein